MHRLSGFSFAGHEGNKPKVPVEEDSGSDPLILLGTCWFCSIICFFQPTCTSESFHGQGAASEHQCCNGSIHWIASANCFFMRWSVSTIQSNLYVLYLPPPDHPKPPCITVSSLGPWAAYPRSFLIWRSLAVQLLLVLSKAPWLCHCEGPAAQLGCFVSCLCWFLAQLNVNCLEAWNDSDWMDLLKVRLHSYCLCHTLRFDRCPPWLGQGTARWMLVLPA